MQTQQGISFFSSAMVLTLGLVAVMVAAALCWLAWHRTGYRRSTGLLELLRFALVCLVVATLNRNGCRPALPRSAQRWRYCGTNPTACKRATYSP